MLTEVINGKRIVLPPEREAEVRQSWKDEEAKKKAVSVDVPKLVTERFSTLVLQYQDDPDMSSAILGAILVKSKEVEAAFDVGIKPAKIVSLMEGITLPPKLAAQRDALVSQYKTLVGVK